ncbi:rCG62810 [Rattus norvegicus]|uniref:RCG62810 n=1 Tax=Rattus norvegicus TaxID=10116 RepID=A6J5X4_RAT|nr:rCG62810 [Rattus norvegicus]
MTATLNLVLFLKSLVPSFLGCLRSPMTTRFLTLIHPAQYQTSEFLRSV